MATKHDKESDKESKEDKAGITPAAHQRAEEYVKNPESMSDFTSERKKKEEDAKKEREEKAEDAKKAKEKENK